MTKPLELTMYPPLSPAVQEAVEWNIEHGWPTYEGFGVEENVPGISAMHAKRLTRAELAAEWHYANMQFHNTTDGTDSGARTSAQFATVHRFATTAHYSEDAV